MTARERIEGSGVNGNVHHGKFGAGLGNKARAFIGMRIMPEGGTGETNSDVCGAQQGKMYLPGLVCANDLPRG
jgi:hypothetical protein